MPYQTYLSKTQCVQPFKGNQHRTQYWFTALVYVCLLIITNLTHANQNCDVHIVQSQIAPAINADPAQRPHAGWLAVHAFPDAASQHWQNPPQQVWYKIVWRYDCPQPQLNPISLVISHIKIAGKVYLNDELLWQDQSLIEPLSRSLNTPRIWNIPASAIQAQNNILWIYATRSTIQEINLGKIHLGPTPQVKTYYQQYRFKQKTLIHISLAINFTVGILFLLAWLLYRKERAYLWTCIVVSFWLAYNFTFLIENPVLDSHQFERLIAWIFSTYTLIGCINLWRFANLRFIQLEKVMLAFGALVTVLLIFTPTAYLLNLMLCLFITNMLVFLSAKISYPFLIYKKKHIELYCLACIQVSYIPVALHDAYQLMQGQSDFWSPYSAPLGAVFLGIVLGLRLYRNNKTIENFNHNLQHKIQAATQAHEISLAQQHKLELENAKLQERMNLAHDLHDGLGGSLVRSMAIVNQSHHALSNHQFLSMLKVLRNDLRQIIDTGSSSGHTAPETPQIWGAAIRYRFIQIFDDLGIESVWHFPPVWQHPPTALECLTYLRVIEEALTNIIKHSQAKNVSVNLFYNDQNQLSLEIEDDGIGFDVNAMLISGMSIGLRSMQLRLEKIGLTMLIQSQVGRTHICVTKKDAEVI